MEDFEGAIARLPRWLLLLSVAGATGAGVFAGLPAAGGFLVGSLGAYFNLRVIEKVAGRIAPAAPLEGMKPARPSVVLMFVRFLGLVLGALVILNFSGFSAVAAVCGFLVCPGAIMLEIVYELVTLKRPNKT